MEFIFELLLDCYMELMTAVLPGEKEFKGWRKFFAVSIVFLFILGNLALVIWGIAMIEDGSLAGLIPIAFAVVLSLTHIILGLILRDRRTKMKILFIGNSYTYFNDMPKLFEGLAQENGKNVQAYSVTEGGRKLYAFSDGADSVTAELDALLSEHHFDACVIQEFSTLPLTDYDAFISGVDCVSEKLQGRADRLVLYSTWGRKEGSPTLAEYGWTNESMTEGLRRAYESAAEKIGAQVSYVGLNFREVYTAHSDIELYDPDLTHPSYQGSCLAALTHYHTVFNEFPENTDSLTLSRDEIAVFKKVVCGKPSQK